MYEILSNQPLNGHGIHRMEVCAPWVADSGQPGQFLIVIPQPDGERIPLTITDIDKEMRAVVVVYQEIGHTTRLLAGMREGESLQAVVGPLGNPAELLRLRALKPESELRPLFVAGGVGIAPIYPQVKWASAQGMAADVVVGARAKDFLFYEEELRSVCRHLYIMTDDGSYGERGLVTQKVDELLSHPGESSYSHCIAIGPLPMMKYVSQTTMKHGLPTIVSLNCMMVDGTGMCGACRVHVGDEVKFCCVDGPEFDGHRVDYDEAMRRLKAPDATRYRVATAAEGHRCNLASVVDEALQKAAADRQKPQEQDPQERANNFQEVVLGFSPAQALVEAGRCLQCAKPRCMEACPVGINIPLFIKHIKENDLKGSYAVIREDSALPAVCGRVCPQEVQCEGACVMGAKNAPIAIGALERYVADSHRCQAAKMPECHPDGPKVAVVGSGPSGLTCAGDLARKGFRVTVFEALHQPGGVLVYGIPEFRLPKCQVVEPEIENLRRMGVEILTNVIVGKSITVDQLLDEKGYAAVYIATGAGLPKFMGIPGETLVGVVSANELLARTNLMHGYDGRHDTPIYLGRKVLVVGGGNVAMDAARTALRLGSEVTVVYRRGEADMPARREEVRHAQEEGVRFRFQTAPVEVLGNADGTVRALRCTEMALGEPDATGRRTFKPKSGSEFEIDADTVVTALGTSPNPLIRSTTPGLECQVWGGIKADGSGRTSRRFVFAGGDAVSGSATVILAMGAGRRAARAIVECMNITKL